MDFSLSSEQQLLQHTVREFAQSEIAPMAASIDEAAEFPKASIAKMADMGLMGMMVPEQFGGSGMGVLSYVLALEEIAAACASTAVIMSVNNSLYCGCILQNGNDGLKKKYLPDYASGRKLGAYALSEPGSGSDAAALVTTATRKGNHYVLNGTKSWITNGPHADAVIVFATVNRDAKHKGITAFVVENDFPGFHVGKVEKKLGIRASSTSEIVLKECVVPAENVLGAEGEGFKVAMRTLDAGRIGIATQAIGIARAAMNTAARHAQERQAFGQAIAGFQGIQWKLADMATAIDAARLLTHRAAWMRDQGMPLVKQAAMAKLFSSEMANDVTREAIQVLGGYGYSKEYPAERYFRDAKITEIYEGTSEIQRIVIAREVLKELAQ